MARGYPDFEGGKSKVYLVPEWAAKEGREKSLTGEADSDAGNWVTIVTYTVPTGKTLYVTDLGVSHIIATKTRFQLRKNSTTLYDIYTIVPHSLKYTILQVYDAGEVLVVRGYHTATSNQKMVANVSGWEE